MMTWSPGILIIKKMTNKEMGGWHLETSIRPSKFWQCFCECFLNATVPLWRDVSKNVWREMTSGRSCKEIFSVSHRSFHRWHVKHHRPSQSIYRYRLCTTDTEQNQIGNTKYNVCEKVLWLHFHLSTQVKAPKAFFH